MVEGITTLLHNVASDSSTTEEDNDEVGIEATEAELKPCGASTGETHQLSENEDLEGEADAETAF